MNKLSVSKRAEIIELLAEGCSVRSTARISGCSIVTILRLLVDAGNAFREYQQQVFVDLPCDRLELDEIWSFIQRKDKHRRENQDGGSIWTWVAFDPETKLIPSWYVGGRSLDTARIFLEDLHGRISPETKLITDGLGDYQVAIDEIWGGEADHGVLDKAYGGTSKRYTGSTRKVISGNLDLKTITTAHIERENGNIRLFVKRFNRKTYCFSKKPENHAHAVSIHFMIHNFCRIHGSLRVSPAMAAGVTAKLWGYEDIVALIP